MHQVVSDVAVKAARTGKIYQVFAPVVPGAAPTLVHQAATLAEAREEAGHYSARRDLTFQDVIVITPAGRREWAGPAR